MTTLLLIDPKAKTCNRYSGRTVTHAFEVESEITAKKVHAMLTAPDTIGEPIEPEAA